MPPSDRDLKTARGWPGGIDNLDKEQSLARDETGRVVIAVRDAENVDLDRQGKPSRRDGYIKRVSASGAHSLWGDPDFPFGLYVDNGKLMGLRDDGEAFQIATGLGLQPVSYALAAGAAYWSSASQHGRITADGRAGPWGITSPPGPPSAVSDSSGGLFAGTYQVTATFLSPTGEESGAPQASLVTLATGAGIQLQNIPQPPDSSWRVRIYATPANGDVFYAAMTLPSGTTAAVLGVHRPGKPLATQFLDVMPPGHIVRWLNGRLYVADHNVMRWTEPLRYGLTHLVNNRQSFQQRLSMMEPLGEGDEGAGMFVASGSKTYWLPGTDPSQFHVKIARAHGVVPGTSLRVPGDVFNLETTAPVVYWLDDSGVGCVGLPGGSVLALKKDQAVGPSADAGASLFRDTGNLRQIITTLVGAKERGLALGDKLECQVYKHTP